MSFKLEFNTHGKGRVRLVKVIRGQDGTHQIIQYNVQLMLEGWDMDDSFTEGSNAKVIPTDTCKNTVYCVANETNFTSMEEFGIALGRHFFATYPDIVKKITINIKSDNWQRLVVPDSSGKPAPHKHSFKRIGPQTPFAEVVAEKANKQADIKFTIKAGFNSLQILKTTQSAFVDFHRCRYTSLPDVWDRLVGTSADAVWTYNEAQVKRGINYEKAHKDIETAMINTFTGPADKGIFSPSVQLTLYQMACASLKACNAIDDVHLYMPNIHNMVFNLEQYGLKNKDHTGNPTIFYPIDEPHGMIKATVSRGTRGKL